MSDERVRGHLARMSDERVRGHLARMSDERVRGHLACKASWVCGHLTRTRR
jgi:hypothetical protein